MSVYKPKNSPYWHYDFQVGGIRFYGSTGTKNKRAAQRREEEVRRQKAEGRKREHMTLNAAFGKYYEEVARHHATASQADYWMENLLKGLGNKNMHEVTDADIATYVARRRGFVSNASVNRETQLLRRVYRQADLNWKVDIGEMPNWGRHLLIEPQGRVRELSASEEGRLFAELREDFHPLVRFALMTGARLSNCIRLTWSEVDYDAMEVRFRQKGGTMHTVPMTHSMQVLLANERGNHPIYVFTYLCARTLYTRQKGKRYPFSMTGWRKVWKRTLENAQIVDFRFHDLRHTAATRMMRATGNLRLVQELLGHTDIHTTTRYAHVTKDDVRKAMEGMEARNIPENSSSGVSEPPNNAMIKRGKSE
jgi:integrase